MKRLIILSILLLATAGVGLFGIKALEIRADARRAASVRAIRPDLLMHDLAGRPTYLRERDEAPTIAIFFTTDCDYCRAEVEHLRARRDRVHVADVVLVSPENVDTLRHYVRRMGLDGIAHLRVLRDRDARLFRHLGIRSVPSTLIYDADGEIVRSFSGLTNVDSMARAFEGRQ